MTLQAESMPEFIVSFAGVKIAITCDRLDILHFLQFLFLDIPEATGIRSPAKINITSTATGSCTIFHNDTQRYTGPLGVEMAAVLFDLVIFHLLDTNNSGLALHAGAVARGNRTIVLPGRSGSGKSSVTTWLTAQGHAYLTDELLFFPDSAPECALPFTRPLCIKAPAVPHVKKLTGRTDHMTHLEDPHGAVIPHRLLNPDFVPKEWRISLLLFPYFCKGATTELQKISGAQASVLLMGCDVNARNLPAHGFPQVVCMARKVPAYRLTYGSFQDFDRTFAELWQTLQWD